MEYCAKCGNRFDVSEGVVMADDYLGDRRFHCKKCAADLCAKRADEEREKWLNRWDIHRNPL